MSEGSEDFPAQWAIDLLRGPSPYKETFYTKYYAEIMCFISGFAMNAGVNFFQNKPLKSNPHRYLIAAVSTSLFGHLLSRLAAYRYAKRDAMIIDYIQRHPDRYPEPRNKKFADLFEPWYPIR